MQSDKCLIQYLQWYYVMAGISSRYNLALKISYFSSYNKHNFD